MSLSYTIDMIAIIKRFILFLLRTFRRALCCFSRKRLESDSQRDVHLEIVNVINDNQQFNKNLSVVNILHFPSVYLIEFKQVFVAYYSQSVTGIRGMISHAQLKSTSRCTVKVL